VVQYFATKMLRKTNVEAKFC